MQLHGRNIEFAFARQRNDAHALVDGLLDQVLLFLARPVQHEIGYRLLDAPLPEAEFPTIQVSAQLPGASPDSHTLFAITVST